MGGIKIALLRPLPAGSADGQLKKGTEARGRAKEPGADIAKFPEMRSGGV